MFSKSGLRYTALPLPDRFDLDDATALSQAESFHGQMARRHTVRDFTDQSVPREVIESCLRTAGSAPSGANHQPWYFACVSEPALKQRIR